MASAKWKKAIIGNKVVVLGVQQRPDMLETLIPRVATGDDVLYVVVHHLMVDLDIVELQHNLIAQAARGIAVMIVLPEIEVLETVLTEECKYVTRNATVANFAALSALFAKALIVCRLEMCLVSSLRCGI